jgi:hypothetical protein
VSGLLCAAATFLRYLSQTLSAHAARSIQQWLSEGIVKTGVYATVLRRLFCAQLALPMLSRRAWPTIQPSLVFREAAKLGGPRRTVIHPADFWDRDSGILLLAPLFGSPLFEDVVRRCRRSGAAIPTDACKHPALYLGRRPYNAPSARLHRLGIVNLSIAQLLPTYPRSNSLYVITIISEWSVTNTLRPPFNTLATYPSIGQSFASTDYRLKLAHFRTPP